MQIRLTVVDPLGPHAAAGDRAASCDVLVTAPAGTALAAVASALAAALPGGEGQHSGQVVLYAGAQRLDAQRGILGEPPLIDGAVLSLGAPGEPDAHTEPSDVPAQLHVVAGPDAGGVHLLHGGQIRLGRSADADVALDDPDVSRMHCAVTVGPDARVSVADLGSTNGTTLDGARVGDRPVRFAPGALLRIGESALRLVPVPPAAEVRVTTVPDGEGHVRLSGARVPRPGSGDGDTVAHARAADGAEGHTREAPAAPATGRSGGGGGGGQGTTAGPGGRTHHAYGTSGYATGAAPAGPPQVPGQAGAPRIESHGTGPTAGRPRQAPAAGETHGGGYDTGGLGADGRGAGGRGDDGRGTSGRGDDGRGASGRGDDGRTHGGDASGAYGPESAVRPGGADAGGYGADAGGYGAGPSGPRGPRTGTPAGGAHGEAPHHGEAPYGGTVYGGAADGVPTRADGTGRKGTPLRGTDVPPGVRRRGGIGAWARRLTGGRPDAQDAAAAGVHPYDHDEAPPGPAPSGAAGASTVPETWPDPASLLLTALGPGPRLWERGPGHPEALTVRLGTADRVAPGGDAPLPAVPVTAGLREVGALGLAGPRARLAGLARSVVAQLAALHSADVLEIVLISADRSRPLAERSAEWSWLGWLPQVRPGHGQDCRLLLAHDREQAAARAHELLRRLEDHLSDDGRTGATPLSGPAAAAPHRPAASGPGARRAGPVPDAHPATTVPHADAAGPGDQGGIGHRPSWAHPDAGADPAGGFPGPYTVVVVDGDPGGADVRETVARLALEGPRAGIHVVCLAETAAASPTSPVARTYEAACAVSPVFRECGAVALLSGDVATTLRLLRVARTAGAPGTPHVPGNPAAAPAGPVGHGTLATVDAVSPAWAERFARALAPLRTDTAAGCAPDARVSAPLPQVARLLDELGLARATPASLMARWADAGDDPQALGGRAQAVLGAGARGPVVADLAAEGPHLLIEGPPGSGRTELLRALVASLASAERPDRLGIVLMDGRDGVSPGASHGEGLRVCTDVPHVTTHLTGNDPVRMREFAQSLSAELKRRAELLGRSDFAEWHTGRELSGRLVAQRTPPAGAPGQAGATGDGDIDSPPSSTMRLRPGAARRRASAVPPLPRLVVVVDDLDALVTPPLGSPGRPAAGSVMRALEAVAREGERLGVHLVAATAPGGRTDRTEPALRATLRVRLDAPVPGPDEPAPGRGRLTRPDGGTALFQGGRVTGRIPRTATLRPTVVPLEWHRMGDPPARRPVRELGNGPTDLALLASALERAAREVSAAEMPSLL
ncbi:FHA domain-containing protein [Streptomyces olivaceus]|uniref:FHA domain-containing protein n=1 Tax=Streptomyces olivaceus TaxID=47716 RepID=UPI001CC96F81|nr:FHA domain-containing protein [Streptomyces olivaceus]MBZ6201135.1 FHA domain-containing protein [Streptomyces olivaceus]